MSASALWVQTFVAYLLIEGVLWMPPGRLGILFMILAALCILVLSLGSRFTAREMGITVPSARGAGWIVAGGIILAAFIPLFAWASGFDAGPARFPLHFAWLYVIWALVQQFMMQSFFFVRMEALLGARWGVLVSALLFAVAHLPNPVLTLGTFVGGLFFCEMFRRHRSIFPLGMVHALLGLTIAASFSDVLLRHMYVGEAYLMFHP